MKTVDAIFCDIDGTLVDDEKNLHQPEIDAIREIVGKGVPFVLVSGRLPGGIFKYRDQLGIDTPIIAFGGGVVLDENGNKLYEQGIDRETVLEVYDYAKEIGSKAAFNYYKNLDWYTDNKAHPVEQWEINSIGLEPVEANPYENTEKGEMISKCLFVGHPEEIDEITPKLQMRFPNLNIIKSLPVLLEVVPKNVDKAKAIEILSKKKGFDIDNSIGIGDNYNDIEMLEAVGIPVIMDNAPEDLKSLENAIITDSNNNNGVSKAIKNYFGL